MVCIGARYQLSIRAAWSIQGMDHSNQVFLIGGGIRGGQVYGRWPGPANGELDRGILAAVTDFRSVLAEVIQRRSGDNALSDMFPGCTPFSWIRPSDAISQSFSGIRSDYGKLNEECRAFAFRAPGPDAPSVRGDDFVADREAEPSSFPFLF